jgi:hypothetical protein
VKLWRRRREGGEPTEADEALELSERQRDRARQRRREFERLAVRMRRMRQVNHLGEAFKDAFGEGR